MRLPRPLIPALLLAVLAPLASGADVYIGVEGGRGESQWPIALPDFLPERPGNSEDMDMGAQLREVIREDLLYSRRFREVNPPQGTQTPNSAEWKKAGAAFYLSAKTAHLPPKVTISAALYDLASGEAVFQRYYRQDAKFWRSAAHTVADDILRQLTGAEGVARTQIFFVNDQTGSKEIYLVDYDGSNLKRLTTDKSINLLPRVSPDKKRLVYTTYKHNNPDLFEMNLETGRSQPVLEYQGLNIAGGFSPDGGRLVVTLAKDKSPNLYLFDFAGRRLRQLTRHFGVESSGTFSPDGEQIAFISDRSGNPQVHIMEIESGRTRRLTTLNWCDSPAWSPSGEFVVFAGRANVKDRMDIFIVDITGQHIRQLTHGEGSNEDPAWSPDGRFIAFTSTRAGKRRQLFVMDSDGSAPHPAADIPGNSFTPAWSKP